MGSEHPNARWPTINAPDLPLSSNVAEFAMDLVLLNYYLNVFHSYTKRCNRACSSSKAVLKCIIMRKRCCGRSCENALYVLDGNNEEGAIGILDKIRTMKELQTCVSPLPECKKVLLYVDRSSKLNVVIINARYTIYYKCNYNVTDNKQPCINVFTSAFQPEKVYCKR